MFVSTFMEIFGFVVRKLTSDCAICHYPGYSSISINSVYITVRLCKYFSHKISIMPKVSQCANSKRPAPLVIILNRIYTQNSIHCNCVHLPSTWSSHLYCTWGTMHLAFINIYTGNNRRCCYFFFSSGARSFVPIKSYTQHQCSILLPFTLFFFSPFVKSNL